LIKKIYLHNFVELSLFYNYSIENYKLQTINILYWKQNFFDFSIFYLVLLKQKDEKKADNFFLSAFLFCSL